MKEQELVTYIDPELKFVRPLMYAQERPVYQVKKQGSFYVLKAFLVDDPWDSNHLNTERIVLERAKDLPGITRLVHFYGIINSRIALLKEYAAGEDLARSPEYKKEAHSLAPLKKQLNDVVNALHKLGIASLDLSARNIVISPDEKSAKIVDLGNCVLQENVDAKTFVLHKINDLHDLERLL